MILQLASCYWMLVINRKAMKWNPCSTMPAFHVKVSGNVKYFWGPKLSNELHCENLNNNFYHNPPHVLFKSYWNRARMYRSVRLRCGLQRSCEAPGFMSWALLDCKFSFRDNPCCEIEVHCGNINSFFPCWGLKNETGLDCSVEPIEAIWTSRRQYSRVGEAGEDLKPGKKLY